MRSLLSPRRLPILAALLLTAGFSPAEARPVVVELFTSQSCSSCPPAEALIGELAREGDGVLPLAYHVTYWNHLDWRDTYSLPAATERQHAYADRLGSSIYTPQAVIDGRTGVVGSHTDAVRSAIAGARSKAEAVSVSIVGVSELTVRLGSGTGRGSVTLVGFDPHHITAVAHGENAGRTLTQANVVRSVTELGRWTGEAQSWTVPRPAGEAAAVIVQDGSGAILGAARTGE